MIKFLASTIKDVKILIRDKAGLAMLFGMPIALILIMTMLQDSTFRALEEKKLPVIVLDMDKDTFGINITNGLKSSKFFNITLQDEIKGEHDLISRVREGEFQIGIVIPANSTLSMRNKIKQSIISMLPEEDSLVFGENMSRTNYSANIDIYFDPITKNSFKQSILSALYEFSAAVESKILFDVYSDLFYSLLDIKMRKPSQDSRIVNIRTYYAGESSEYIPNSVQHNVPAWTIFAMFFIVIPLAGNIIRERESGISKRLRIIAGSDLPVIMGKVSTFFFVGLIQAASMLAVGVYVLPLLGLPHLSVGSSLPVLAAITVFVSLAASGYGVLIGTIATSQEQASIFGSISVVILAAIGGIWVPVFMMSSTMQIISSLSPLNWAINGYYDIFLRKTDIIGILPYALKLFSFFAICISISWFVKKNRILE